MRLRAFRVRAILFPLGVALASVTAVAWYGLVKIPAQQRYITDRNLRLLKTKGAQIKSKVDNFDISIDNALDFYPQPQHTRDAVYAEELQRYVRMFAPGLEILAEYETEAARAMYDWPADPPRVVIQRDEGRNFLYLGYNHDRKTIVARSDIEQVLAPYLSSGTEFDVVLLATRNGSVIAQQSATGLELAHVDGLRDSMRPAQSGSGDSKTTPAPSLFESLRTSTNVANVTLGNAEYQLYIQPVQLSLASAVGSGDGPEEWALCGLVRADHFRAAGAAISSTYLLWFGVALATVCLAIPLLKLHILSPNERLQRSDGVLVAAATFLSAGLLTFCAIDTYYFHFEVNDHTRRELTTAARAIGAHFTAEADAIAAQMKELRERRLWNTLNYDDKKVNFNHLPLKDVPPNELPTTMFYRGKDYFCDDEWACRDNILVKDPSLFGSYPYFESVLWVDDAGWQRVKWSAGRVTPLLNLASIPYFQQLASSRALSRDGAGGSGIGVVQSRNTGDMVTVFWEALSNEFAAEGPHLIGQAMLTTPISLVNPVLPAHTQFAVIDNTGHVMFHSDAARSLRENFFVECEEDPQLRSAVSGRRSEHLNASYFARRYALYVTPLDLSSFGDPGWTLVVLHDRSVLETVNLETLALSVLLFGVYAAVLALLWALLRTVWPARVRKWFWPDRSAGAAYRVVMIVNAALSVLFLGGIAHFDSTRLLLATSLLVTLALISTFMLVTRVRPANGAAANWEALFHGARVSFLFVIAAIPAMACFLVAYDFEMTLLAKSGQTSVAAQLDARDDRINARAGKFPLCSKTLAADECRDVFAGFIARRTATSDVQNPWDVNIPLADVGPSMPADPPAVTRLDAFLASLHLSYNDVAVELAAVLPPPRADHAVGAVAHRWRQWLDTKERSKVQLAKEPESPQTITSEVMLAAPTALLWIVAAGVIGILYVLVRFVVRPLYVLELYGTRVLAASDINIDSSGHLLLVGPPGSGKSSRLATERHIRIFDARTRSFFERRVAARPVPVERRHTMFAKAGAFFGFPGRDATVEAESSASTAKETGARGDWLDVSHLPTDPNVLIGIDHLEYSLDDPVDRAKMLRFLEELTYHHKRTVCVAAAREPITQLGELPDHPPDCGEMARWIRVFQSFREERIGLTRRRLGEPYYRAIWSTCSKIEQLALRQLADEGVVNPRNAAVVAQLMRSGLVRRDRTFHIMDTPFRRFVMQAISADDISAREGDGVSLPWASVTTAALTVALGLGALLVLTSQQLVDAWIGYVPALAPAVPTVLKLLGSARGDSKSTPVNA